MVFPGDDALRRHPPAAGHRASASPFRSSKTLPAQRKKLEDILRYVVCDFEPGKPYSEKQVKETLSRYPIDTTSLRRELVGTKLMEREGGGGEYWRTDK